jgi:UDPglucose 6-dehydrogenase
MDKAKRLTEPSESITWCQNLWDAASGADAVAIATEWSCFKEMDLLRLKACMRTPILFDGRNIFSPEDISGKGFFYFSIGRPTPRFSVECEPMVAQQGSQHNPTCSTL